MALNGRRATRLVVSPSLVFCSRLNQPILNRLSSLSLFISLFSDFSLFLSQLNNDNNTTTCDWLLLFELLGRPVSKQDVILSIIFFSNYKCSARLDLIKRTCVIKLLIASNSIRTLIRSDILGLHLVPFSAPFFTDWPFPNLPARWQVMARHCGTVG